MDGQPPGPCYIPLNLALEDGYLAEGRCRVPVGSIAVDILCEVRNLVKRPNRFSTLSPSWDTLKFRILMNPLSTG